MPDDRYLDPYRRGRTRRGPGFRAAMWSSRRSQIKRFEVFTRMFPLAGKRILDAGCSRGDLAQYLIHCGIDFNHYTGIDAIAPAIQHAISRDLPNCEFHHGDFLQNPQLLSLSNPGVICISGTLNTMTPAQAMTLLNSAWDATSYALLFNFLSDRATPDAPAQLPPVHRHDTAAILHWALSKSPRLRFRNDYFRHGHDATILMRK